MRALDQQIAALRAVRRLLILVLAVLLVLCSLVIQHQHLSAFFELHTGIGATCACMLDSPTVARTVKEESNSNEEGHEANAETTTQLLPVAATFPPTITQEATARTRATRRTTGPKTDIPTTITRSSVPTIPLAPLVMPGANFRLADASPSDLTTKAPTNTPSNIQPSTAEATQQPVPASYYTSKYGRRSANATMESATI